MFPLFRPVATLGVALALLLNQANAADSPVVEAKNGMVVSVSPPGTEVGLAVLEKDTHAPNPTKHHRHQEIRPAPDRHRPASVGVARLALRMSCEIEKGQ